MIWLVFVRLKLSLFCQSIAKLLSHPRTFCFGCLDLVGPCIPSQDGFECIFIGASARLQRPQFVCTSRDSLDCFSVSSFSFSE